MKKQDLTKLSKADELSIAAIQEEVLVELENILKTSRHKDNFRFDRRLLTYDRRKQVRKKVNKILKKYNDRLENVVEEMLDYNEKDELIEFINMNLPARIKQDKEKEEHKEYLRLKKKFEK